MWHGLQQSCLPKNFYSTLILRFQFCFYFKNLFRYPVLSCIVISEASSFIFTIYNQWLVSKYWKFPFRERLYPHWIQCSGGWDYWYVLLMIMACKGWFVVLVFSTHEMCQCLEELCVGLIDDLGNMIMTFGPLKRIVQWQKIQHYTENEHF